MVQEFYREQFWNKINGDEIPNQELADQVYDMAVNSGVGTAKEMLKQLS
jgi:lysozyme family protein